MFTYFNYRYYCDFKGHIVMQVGTEEATLTKEDLLEMLEVIEDNEVPKEQEDY